MVLENEIIRAEKFIGSKYDAYVKEAKNLYYVGEVNEALQSLKNIPTNEQLIHDLIFKLKGKPVFNTIKNIVEGKETNRYRVMVGYSSLITHAIIECEHGNEYYILIVEELLSKLQRAIYS